MKSAAIASIFFAGAALAIPVAEKRGVTTDVVVTTVWTTTTITIPGPTDGAFFEKARKSSSSSASSTSASSSSTVAPAPSVQPVVAAPSAAPAAPSAAPAAQPSAAPAPVAAAPATDSGSSSGSGPSGTGDATYYEVNGTPGSCGIQKSDSDAVVALSHLTMNNGGNSNSNPLCGKTINIQGTNGVHQAMVYDTCEGCDANSIDLSPSLFKAAFPSGDGRVHNVKWWVS